MTEQNSSKKSFIFGLVAGVAIVSTIGFVVLLATGFSGEEVEKGSGENSSATTLQKILQEISPTGIPDYGDKAGVSYDKVEQSLSVLTGFDKSITLDGEQKQSYVKIGSVPLTACEFCCGIKENGFIGNNGSPACGCSHNIAFSGLTKWLIQNSSYTDNQIVSEIGKWKILFFPKGAVEKEARRRGIIPAEGELPAMKGGC